MKKIEHATAAKVCAERDRTTVVIVGRVPDVERARDMIEDLLAKNGIDFRGKPGRGFPLDRGGPRVVADRPRDGEPNNPGGDLRGLLKRKSLDAEQPRRRPRRAPRRRRTRLGWRRSSARCGRARVRASRAHHGRVRAKLASDDDDKKTRAGGGGDKGDTSADEDLVPVADKMMMSRVIGKKQQVMAMLCKIAGVKIFMARRWRFGSSARIRTVARTPSPSSAPSSATRSGRRSRFRF